MPSLRSRFFRPVSQVDIICRCHNRYNSVLFAGDDGCAGDTDDLRPHHARTQGDPILLKVTRCEIFNKAVAVRTLSQLLPGANNVVNALRFRTKAFIAGLVQRRCTPWSKP
jgi:hypothetical protein